MIPKSRMLMIDPCQEDRNLSKQSAFIMGSRFASDFIVFK